MNIRIHAMLNLNPIQKRIARRITEDGLHELTQAVKYFIGGLLMLTQVDEPTRLVFVIVLFVLVELPITNWFKARITHPRTGYFKLRYPDEDENRLRGLAAILVIIGLLIVLGVVVWSFIRFDWLYTLLLSPYNGFPLLYGVLLMMALGALGYISQQRRFYGLGIGVALMGIGISLLNIQPVILSITVFMLAVVPIYLFSGGWSLLRFVRRYPIQEANGYGT